MKIISYVGTESENIVIQRPTDILPLLDWCQSKMIEKEEESGSNVQQEKWKRSSKYLSELMEKVEKDGFGSYEDIENVEY